MNVSKLDTIRDSLFAAIDDVKLAVNTEEFNNKVAIVNEHGLAFALESAILSKDQAFQIEELFSTTIPNKDYVISEFIRILGFRDTINFGPGGRVLLGGDMTNGYFGEVSSTELFTGSELASLLNVTQGTLINDAAGWLKFARYGNIIYIAKRNVRHTVSANYLNNLNAIYGSDPNVFIEKNNNQFVPRLMTGHINDPGTTTEGDGSDWNSLIYKVHQDIPTSQVGDNWDEFGDIDLEISRTTMCQENSRYNGIRYVRSRGGSSIEAIDGRFWSTGYSFLGWRPVLALKQEDGSYSTGREHYPQ